MDNTPQFCLRWNNYQSTLHHIFHKLWSSGTFVDVSLVVEGKKIECHKIILSACSTYFEKLLSEHSAHPHPLILLHDIPVSAVEALVVFMYKGEINVSHDQLMALLKAADTLKIKGLADYAISDITKYRLLSPEIAKAFGNQYPYPPTNSSTPSPFVPTTSSSSAKWYPGTGSRQIKPSVPQNLTTQQNGPNKRHEPGGGSSSSHPPLKKRPRQDDSSSSLPPSPRPSSRECQNQEQAKVMTTELPDTQEIKVEPEDETDNELQIDESAGQSPEESVESDSVSNRNTPVLEFDPQELRERHETAQSLAALATQGAINFTPSQSSQANTVQPLQLNQNMFAPKTTTRKIKEEKTHSGGCKGTEGSYTFQDLEEGIESVLTGQLTPAKAIAKYKVPRRTFFRRLSAVRKSRGIPSSKENNASSDHFLNSKSSSLTTNQVSQGKNSHVPLIIPGIVSNESFLQNICNVPKEDGEDLKKDKKTPGLNLSTGNVFGLLNVANVNYDYYLKYFKQQSQSKESLTLPEVKKEPTVDGNSNLSSEVSGQALGLVAQNGSLS